MGPETSIPQFDADGTLDPRDILLELFAAGRGRVPGHAHLRQHDLGGAPLSDCQARVADAANDFLEGERSAPTERLGYLNPTGFPAMPEIQRRFLPADPLAKCENSIGEYDPEPRVGARAG